MKGNFQTLLRKFCLESTVLGLKYFYLYPDRLSRCFWSVNTVAVIFLSFTLTSSLYNRFADMPTQITIENQNELTSDLPYPSITICSPNQITVSSLDDLIRQLGNETSQLNLQSSIHSLLGFYEILADGVTTDTGLKDMQADFDRVNITIPHLMGRLAQSCDSFLELCYFDMIPYPNCKGLLEPILTTHGLCCTFNNKYSFNGEMNQHKPESETRTVQSTGESRGLVIVGDYNPDDGVDGTILSGGAVKVIIVDSSEFPSNREMTLVETNTESFHILNAAFTYCSEDVLTLLPRDRRCFLEDEFNLPHFKTYSKSDCVLMCLIETMEEECACVMFYVVNVTTHRLCNVTHIPCIIQVKYLSNAMYNCGCLPECVSRQYTSDVIIGNFNAMPYMLQNRYDGIKFNKSTFIMKFFFTNAMYVKKKQETVMSLTILASNLGGIFGLCIGCSYISVLEILFYMYMVLKNYYRRNWQRSFIRVIEYKN